MFFNKSKTRVIISDEKFGIIRDNVKLNHIPRDGEFIFFDKESQYWVVLKVVHNISKKNTIWVVVIPQEINQIP